MKKLSICLSLGILTLALPAHSAILKEKSNRTVVQKSDFTNNSHLVNFDNTYSATPITVKANTLPVHTNTVSLASTPMLSNYPKLADMVWIGTNINTLNNVPKPTLTVSAMRIVPTVIIPSTKQGNEHLNVSVLDDFINDISPMARHYPPVFVNRTDRYNTIQRIKAMVAWIDNYASNKNASYDVLLRATKLNAMARNLDLGSEYAVRANNYGSRAIKLNDTAEANFLYGAMLAEGGGFDEGAKYLEKAERMGFAEASQSLAQADLLNDKKEQAIQRLYDFKDKYPDNPYIDEQIRLVNRGEYYIWNIPMQPVRQ